MKVLMIGQLPKEAGGNYTTGAGNVVFALTQQKSDGLDMSMYVKNASYRTIKKRYGKQSIYIGYRFLFISILKDFLLNPFAFIKEWHHFSKIDHENPFRYVFYKANIRRSIGITRPDIIHVHSIKDVSPTRFALGKNNIPILLTCHGVAYRGNNCEQAIKDRYMGNLPMCNYFTGLTKEAAFEFKVYLNIPEDKFSIIPNGVDVNKFYYSEKDRSEIRSKLGANDSQIVFITVASLQKRKGQLEFIRLIREYDDSFQYWLIGGGEDEINIRQYIEMNNLESKVKLIGYIPNTDLYSYYSAADIYVHSSLREGQALSEIEAYTTGMRIVVNKEVAETVVGDVKNDNQRYFVYEAGKTKLKDFRCWLKKEAPERKTYSNFSWAEIIKQYFEVYKMMYRG